MWDRERSVWVALTDEHEITKRIRKPWMQHLIQTRIGEHPSSEADLAKLVSFLMTKVTLTDEEKAAVSAVLERNVTLADLERLNVRYKDLNRIIEAYNSPFVLKPGVNAYDDPLLSIGYI